jgi:molybdopterin/thiamine biosynthesis adenylyltransferase
MDLSRHISVFTPDNVKHPIHIIGVGATGSFVAMMLARMGCPVLNIYDFDDVEIHNIPNQYYDTGDLGKLKAEALAEKLKAINPNIVVNVNIGAVLPTHDDEHKGIDEMAGYVFLLVDSMKIRRELWEAVKLNKDIIHCWESRLGSDQARVYSLDMSVKDFSKYEVDFYDDDVAEMSACGTSITVLPVVLQTASLMIVQFIDIVMDRVGTYYFKTIFDHYYNKYEESFEVSEVIVEEVPVTQDDLF